MTHLKGERWGQTDQKLRQWIYVNAQLSWGLRLWVSSRPTGSVCWGQVTCRKMLNTLVPSLQWHYQIQSSISTCGWSHITSYTARNTTFAPNMSMQLSGGKQNEPINQVTLRAAARLLLWLLFLHLCKLWGFLTPTCHRSGWTFGQCFAFVSSWKDFWSISFWMAQIPTLWMQFWLSWATRRDRTLRSWTGPLSVRPRHL